VSSFFLFSLFFPHVSSGPIPRANDLVPQLMNRHRLTSDDFSQGISLIAFGLLKKFVIAHRLFFYANQVFSTDLPISTAPLILGIAFNALSLYADFSAYTDIARGSARLFGIRLAENFDRPFSALSVTDFWRRWHISFSRCLKDYLYLPLVIRLRFLGKSAVVVSFAITFVICGLWHKTAWTFVIFGLLHGAALGAEFLSKRWRARFAQQVPRTMYVSLARVYALSFIFLTIVLFSAGSLSGAIGMYARLFTFSLPQTTNELFAYQGPVMFALIFMAMAIWGLCGYFFRNVSVKSAPAFTFICGVLVLLLGELKEGDFIYVQF